MNRLVYSGLGFLLLLSQISHAQWMDFVPEVEIDHEFVRSLDYLESQGVRFPVIKRECIGCDHNETEN